jgi:hypothetical protein
MLYVECVGHGDRVRREPLEAVRPMPVIERTRGPTAIARTSRIP